MNLEDLRVFKEVAKHANMTKAAESLNFVQSNVTAKMKRLEQKYKTKLIYRHKQGVELTSPGKMLLSYAVQTLQLMDDAEKSLKESHAPSGTLSIGSMETTTATRLPRILSGYHDHYPAVELSLQTGTTKELIKAALKREIDGAFVAGEVRHPNLVKTEAFEEELMLIAKKNSLSNAEFDQLDKQLFIVFKSGCFYRDTLEKWLESKGIIPTRMMELNTLDGIMGCVQAGLGVSLLPKTATDQLNQSKTITRFPLPEPYGKVQTWFIHHKDIVQTSAFCKFKEIFYDEGIVEVEG